MAVQMIIDGDGHVLEDDDAIANKAPSEWGNPGLTRRNLFPELDHVHNALRTTPPGSFLPAPVDRWIEFQDDVGISSAILYPTSALSCGRIVDVDLAIGACAAYNDWLHEAFTARSPRLIGMGLIPMQEPSAAVEELRRCVLELGMKGVMLPSTGLPSPLGAKEYWPIYAEADKLGCAVAVHGGCHQDLGMNHLNVFAATHAMGHPFGIMISFGSMLFNGIFDRFPNARYGFLEGGVAWFLMALERFTGSYNNFVPHDPRGEYLQLREGEQVSDYICRHVSEGRLFVGIEGDEPSLVHAVKTAGSGAFVFSSDFPHEVNNEGIKHDIQELLVNEELSPEDKDAILRGNAVRFYGL